MGLFDHLLNRPAPASGGALDPELPGSPLELGKVLAEIEALHLRVETECASYIAVTEGACATARAQYAKALEGRLAAAENRHLPMAILAAQLAAAERHCVRQTVAAVLADLEATATQDGREAHAIATAVRRLRALLAAIPPLEIRKTTGVPA